MDDCMTECMICCKEFGLLSRRRHCRACGNLVCHDCCKRLAYLEGSVNLGKQFICDNCEPVKADVKAHPEVQLIDTLTNWGESLDSLLNELSNDNFSNLPKSLKVIPSVGFVIKTYRRTDQMKAFINVFHHDSVVDDDLKLCYDPKHSSDTSPYGSGKSHFSRPNNANSAYSSSSLTPHTSNFSFGSALTLASTAKYHHGEEYKDENDMILPVVYIGNYIIRQDKEGKDVIVYNILVSSDYFATSSSFHQHQQHTSLKSIHITDNSSVNKIIQIINQRYSECYFEDMFVLPAIKKRVFGIENIDTQTFLRSDISVKCHPDTIFYNMYQKLHLSRKVRYADGLDPKRSSSSSIISSSTSSSLYNRSLKPFTRKTRGLSLFQSTCSLIQQEDFLQPSMLTIKIGKMITKDADMALKLNSLTDPNILLGYQIVIPYDMEQDTHYRIGKLPIDTQNVYIIIDSAKSNFRKTEFKIINLNDPGPIWVRLQRGDKPGVPFRLMRHVVNLLYNY